MRQRWQQLLVYTSMFLNWIVVLFSCLVPLTKLDDMTEVEMSCRSAPFLFRVAPSCTVLVKVQLKLNCITWHNIRMGKGSSLLSFLFQSLLSIGSKLIARCKKSFLAEKFFYNDGTTKLMLQLLLLHTPSISYFAVLCVCFVCGVVKCCVISLLS